jgi:hypothetical protein
VLEAISKTIIQEKRASGKRAAITEISRTELKQAAGRPIAIGLPAMVYCFGLTKL